MTSDQRDQLDKVRAMFARAAHSDAPGEQEVAARMAMSFMTRYNIRSADLLVGLKGPMERDYNLQNYYAAKRILENPPPKVVVVDTPPRTVVAPPPPPSADGFKRVWVNGYVRKNGVKVNGYWRLTRPLWVASYTRKDGKKVAGYWRCADMKAAA
jgi:hypothetical protein